MVLFILSGMLILLLNNSGVDRRIALWLLCSGDSCQFSGKRYSVGHMTTIYHKSVATTKHVLVEKRFNTLK